MAKPRPWYLSICIGFLAGLILGKLMPTHSPWNSWQWWVGMVPAIAFLEAGYWLVKKIIGEDNAAQGK